MSAASQEPTLRERVQVHRAVEWLRVRGRWGMDEGEDALTVLEASGLVLPDSEPGRGLLVDEIARLKSAIDESAEDAQQLFEPDWMACIKDGPAADPFGDIAGERPGMSCLHFRRVSRRLARRDGVGVEGAVT